MTHDTRAVSLQRGESVSGSPRPRGKHMKTVATRSRLIFGLPAGLAIALMLIYPLCLLVSMSFHTVSAGTLNQSWPFAGLDNFTELFSSKDLPGVILNTLLFVIIVTVVATLGGLGAALVLRTKSFGASLLLALMVFVWALPPVVNGSIWKFLLADKGLLNAILTSLGLVDSGVPFLYNPDIALFSVALVTSWSQIPFNALMFRSALLAVDQEVLEAASVDGARPSQEIRYILLPAVRPTAMVLGILTIVYAFRSFDFIFVMTSGGPGTATTTLPFLSYQQSFIRYDYGLGSATSVIGLVVVLVIGLYYAWDTSRKEA